MMKNNIAFIANYLWMESIRNLNLTLSEADLRSFSNQDYYYLTTIYYMDQPNFSQVAEALGLTKPAISVLSNKLAKIGLLEKIQSTEDKRVFHLCVTEKGKRIIEGDEALYSKINGLIRNITAEDGNYEYLEGVMAELERRLKQG